VLIRLAFLSFRTFVLNDFAYKIKHRMSLSVFAIASLCIALLLCSVNDDNDDDDDDIRPSPSTLRTFSYFKNKKIPTTGQTLLQFYVVIRPCLFDESL